MFKHISAYFTSPEFDALRRAANTGRSERTDLMENSTRSQPEATKTANVSRESYREADEGNLTFNL